MGFDPPAFARKSFPGEIKYFQFKSSKYKAFISCADATTNTGVQICLINILFYRRNGGKVAKYKWRKVEIDKCKRAKKN